LAKLEAYRARILRVALPLLLVAVAIAAAAANGSWG
jgi:hypothetical protein